MSLQILKAELLSGHPITGAYDADHAIAAQQLNAKNRTRDRATMMGSEFFNATDHVEFGVLTTENKSRWVAICSIDELDVTTGIARSLEAELFGPGTSTRTNLLAIRSQSISRAEQLGLGRIRPGTVQQARENN